MRFAFVGCEEKPNGTTDDQLLAKAVRSLGSIVESVVWSDESVDWSLYDFALLRSTWDYHRNLDQFLLWCSKAERSLKLVNSSEVVRWNSSKKYLLELKAAGCSIVPSEIDSRTTILESHAKRMLESNDAIVIKPAVSATADLTSLVQDFENARIAIESAQLRGDVVLQPFIKSIAEDGEVSLIYFFEGEWKYSHATIKRARTGDFRVQSDFGGTSEAFQASSELIHEGARCLKFIPGKAFYARVDLVDWKQKPLIGELELIEPELFFRHGDPAFAARALLSW